MEPTTDAHSKSAGLQHSSIHGSEVDAAGAPRGVEPELAAAIAHISPERRAAIEKKVKSKLDFILFPTLLAFYILNYIVC